METDYQHLWILDGHTPIPCPDVLKWGHWFETADRTVAQSKIGNFLISTVFLGTNERIGLGTPILFETIVFQNNTILDEYSMRYSTWDEAIAKHQAVVAQVEALN